MIRHYALVSLLLNFLTSVYCFTFVPSLSSSFGRADGCVRTRRASVFLSATTVDTNDNENTVIVASVDDIVLDTRDWRIRNGIQAAIDTWPHLSDLLSVEEDTSWLLNKMEALSHCMTNHVGYSHTCDYALLARLLLEEQALDQGKSSGKSGKYASRFHPSISNSKSSASDESSSSIDNSNESSSSNGSRPLTVGEIEVNWRDGACLSETLLSRYSIDKKNPLAAIQASIERQCRAEQQHYDESSIMPVQNEVVCQALSTCPHRLILRVGHVCDLPMIQSCLQKTLLHDLPVVPTVQEALSVEKGASLLIDDTLSDVQLYKQVLLQAPPQSTLHVIDYSWNSLQNAKVLFGDYIPRKDGKAKTVIGENQQLSLHVWSHSASVASRNSAEMDPWTNLMTRQGLLDLLFAKVGAFE